MHPKILFLVILFLPAVNASRCRRECGGVSVPYPFGLGNPECYHTVGALSSFKLICNETKIMWRNIQVVNISVEEGTASAEIHVAVSCKNDSWHNTPQPIVDLEGSPFTFSSKTRFTIVGCSVLGLISQKHEDRFTTGCFSGCSSKDADYAYELNLLLKNNTHNCSGVSCCQTPIPNNLKAPRIGLANFNELYPCSFGFLGPKNYKIKEYPDTSKYSVVSLDWYIGNRRCNKTKPICGPNTDCIDSQNGLGYQCICKDGFHGNPYESTGCIDIDECLERNREKYPCYGTCKNTLGNYSCHCSFPHAGDGKVGCRLGAVAKVMIGIGSCIFIVSSVLPQCLLYKRIKAEKNLVKNGGLFLEHLSVKIYKEAQLKKATNNYHCENLLGEGANGSVYKGLDNNTDIAVKRSKLVNQDKIEQFLNEVEIVSKINHKNVVKLLGVCLETKVPLLVYEYVTNGTLFNHIHGKDSRSILYSWPSCLKIAAETAGALDYMHSLANPPIIHRDIKTSNILLDGKYTAKVADFGASKLIAVDETITPTRGQGTLGYLDPEYLQTGELTVKSDVYGFGVVLMELLFKETQLYKGVSGETISLVQFFMSAVEDNCLDQFLKIGDVNEHGIEQVHIVAKLAVKCVRMPSKDRPTMTEVADVLNGLSKEYHSFRIEESSIEQANLLRDQEILTTSVSFDLE